MTLVTSPRLPMLQNGFEALEGQEQEVVMSQT